MTFKEGLFRVLTVIAAVNVIIPAILTIIFYFGKDTQVFAYVTGNALAMGICVYIALNWLKKKFKVGKYGNV